MLSLAIIEKLNKKDQEIQLQKILMTVQSLHLKDQIYKFMNNFGGYIFMQLGSCKKETKLFLAIEINDKHSAFFQICLTKQATVIFWPHWYCPLHIVKQTLLNTVKTVLL